MQHLRLGVILVEVVSPETPLFFSALALLPFVGWGILRGGSHVYCDLQHSLMPLCKHM